LTTSKGTFWDWIRGILKAEKRLNQMRSILIEEGNGMSIRTQAERIGFHIVGDLKRCMGMEPSHLYRCYFDDAENKYIVYRGILTIVAADGKVL
jgi:hypothetical protein